MTREQKRTIHLYQMELPVSDIAHNETARKRGGEKDHCNVADDFRVQRLGCPVVEEDKREAALQ
jgi:hypothetical protein